MAGDATPKETRRCGVFPTLRAVSPDCAPAWQLEVEGFSGNASPETTFFTYVYLCFLLATAKFSLLARRAMASAAQMAHWARHLHSRR
jgi:hypothetical protein